MTGPAAEAVVRDYLADFERMIGTEGRFHVIYFPEREGPAEEWVDVEGGDSVANYIPKPLDYEKRFAAATDSLILLSKPTTGRGFVTLTHMGAYPQLGGFGTLDELVKQTNALLANWEDFKRQGAPSAFPWGWVITGVVLATAVGGAVWYARKD